MPLADELSLLVARLNECAKGIRSSLITCPDTLIGSLVKRSPGMPKPNPPLSMRWLLSIGICGAIEFANPPAASGSLNLSEELLDMLIGAACYAA
jgi:hypothetical protein